MQNRKIPKNAKKVFNGVIWDVYQWKQRMFDGSYAKFETIKRAGTVMIMPTIGSKVVISIEEQPASPKTVGLISGRIERGESPLNAAKRELLEETGLKSKNWKLFKVQDVVPTMKIDWNIHYYIAKDCKKVAEPTLDAGERIKTMLVDFNTLMRLPSRRNVDGWLAREISRIRSSKKETSELRRMLSLGKR